jgi:hypothetical protein
MLVLASVFIIAGFLTWQFISTALPMHLLEEMTIHSESLKTGLSRVATVAATIKTYYIPMVSALFLVCWLLLWGLIRASLRRVIRQSETSLQAVSASSKKDKKTSASEAPAPVIDKKEMMETHKRFYLHLMTVLQREGRLMDFFAEDLSAYEDNQIGAAVRSIQDNCKTALKKHLNPKAVMEQNEGDEIVVPADFDTSAIKLTGNVSGEPPFQGVLRHKGWRASKLELPTLSAAKDSHIIAPAEIEIV